jgi:hypothetical protein
MLTGCFGLLAAAADKFPEFRDELKTSLLGGKDARKVQPPWELD